MFIKSLIASCSDVARVETASDPHIGGALDDGAAIGKHRHLVRWQEESQCEIVAPHVAKRLQTLFQPFKSTKSNGLGLGLYQCKRIIEEHGGTMRIRSEAGRGTQVRIELPAAVSGPPSI